MNFYTLYATIIFFLLLFSLFGKILADPSNRTESIEKVGILESVAKVFALLLPPITQKKPENNETDEITYGTVPGYPLCPSTCSEAWMGDDWCDSNCASAECGHDGGDCDGWCAADCKPGWVGDGLCDVDCFRQECKWDENDCAHNFTMTQLQHPLPTHKQFDYSRCPTSCDRSLLHNGDCDKDCNLVECNFDGEDCYHQCAPKCFNAWLGDGGCDPDCNVEACGFDKGDCKICKPGCEAGMVGNGICDTVCNAQECQSDIGDCYAVCWVAEKIDYNTEPFFYPHCRTEWKGDGYCDCFCMNEACDFDHGDCKGYDCSIEFALLRELNQQMGATDDPFPKSGNFTDLLSSFVTKRR